MALNRGPILLTDTPEPSGIFLRTQSHSFITPLYFPSLISTLHTLHLLPIDFFDFRMYAGAVYDNQPVAKKYPSFSTWA